MGFADLPPELFEQILVRCDLRQVLRCKAVSKSFNEFITTSARLTYHIDLFISGFEDTKLNPHYNLQDRRTILSSAQNIWRGTNSMTLLQTLHLSNLEYWPIRDSVLLRRAITDDAVTLDISRISSSLDDDADSVLSHWQVCLQKTTGSIACIDASQDLLIVRYHGPSPTPHSEFPNYQGQHYCLSIYSLRTGAPHPQAKHHRIEFEMSKRVTQNPHYTRVQVLDGLLAVNMASGFQLFTETALFDWMSGERKGVFCSPGTSARSWGHSAVLISDKCFLQPCYSSAESRPAIEVYVLHDRKDPNSDEVTCEASHVATYWLPRVINGDVRLVINITSRQQVSSNDEDGGYLLSSSYARMLHIQVTGVWFTSPFQCAFFTPAHQFIDESLHFFSLPPNQRCSYEPRNRAWSSWGNTSTRWLEKNGPVWHEQAKSNMRGSGSRYAFPKYLVDFSPLDVAREVYRQKQTHPYTSDCSASFPSEAKGWTTHYHSVTKAQISGAEMFDEHIVSCLPYREKEMDVLPEYEIGSDVLLVNDKIVSVQGGILDVIKIYKPVASQSTITSTTNEQETDELVDALRAISLRD